ncbi:hypothetical protein MP638_000587 [Amoeboaphelidium occidentale]|nr:hypothetical protein MP638_000587 [Amoeboaphelidium occidentale]
MKEGRKGKGLRLFSLLPIVKVRTGRLLIGSSILYEILKLCLDSDCTALKDFPTSLATFLKEDVVWWKQLFNYDKFESVAKQRTFKFTISTDAVSVSIHLKRPVHNSTFNDHGYTVDKKNYDILVLSNSVIIGVDPGRRDVFVAAKYPSDITKHEGKNMKQKQKKKKEKKKRKKIDPGRRDVFVAAKYPSDNSKHEGKNMKQKQKKKKEKKKRKKSGKKTSVQGEGNILIEKSVQTRNVEENAKNNVLKNVNKRRKKKKKAPIQKSEVVRCSAKKWAAKRGDRYFRMKYRVWLKYGKNMKQKQKKKKEKKKRKKNRKITSVQGEGNILIEKSVQTKNVEENAQNNVHKNVKKRRRKKKKKASIQKSEVVRKNMKQKQKKKKEKKKRKKSGKKTSVQGEGNILIEKSVITRNVEENAKNNVLKNVNKRRRKKKKKASIQKSEVVRCSAKEWAVKRGDRYFRKKYRVWLKYGTGVKKADQKQLTSKVPTVKGFCDFVRTGWDRYNVVSGFYGSKRWRKLR